MRDRRLIAIVGAGAIVVALILVIVFTSITPIPDFAELAGSGQSGYVAFAPDDGADRGAITIVDLATATSVVVDVRGEGEPLGWDADGHLVLSRWGPGVERFVLVDPATGDVVGELEAEDGERFYEQVDPVWIDHRDERLVLERDRDGTSASFPAPESYDVSTAAPMGAERIVFVDELGRVAVVDPGEDVVPVLVAEGAREWWRVTGRDQ